MRIFIVANVFLPEPVTSARLAGDFAGELARRGHEVTVFAPFPNRPVGEVQSGYRRSWRSVEHRNGYRVVRVWGTFSKSSTVLSRLAENVSFGLSSALAVRREPPPDVAFIGAWPIFATWMVSTVFSRRRVPTVCSIKDLYPETLLDSKGMSPSHPLFRLLRSMDRRSYRRASLVTALNSTQRDYLIADRGVPEQRVEVFQDWVDASAFPENQVRNGAFRERHGLSPDLFLAMYVGSLTRMAGLGLFVEAAEKLRSRQDIRLLLVGDGAMRREVEEAIDAKGLENIRIIHPLAPEDVPDVQAGADVLLLSLLPGAAVHTTPSKLIYYMFSGRPVLASVEEGSPPAELVRDASCGYVVRTGDAAQLADRLAAMADDKESLTELGRNARLNAELHFSRAKVLPRFCDMIERVARSR